MSSPSDTVILIHPEKWREHVLAHMQLAQACALRFAMRHRVHFDEAIAEAYYLLVLHVLRYTRRFVDSNFNYTMNLRSHIMKRLWDYFKTNRLICVSDMLGDDWREKYGQMLGAIDYTIALKELVENIVDDNTEMSILILAADGYSNTQIAELLGVSNGLVARVIKKIQHRLGDTAETTCRHSFPILNSRNPPDVSMIRDLANNASNVSNYLMYS